MQNSGVSPTNLIFISKLQTAQAIGLIRSASGAYVHTLLLYWAAATYYSETCEKYIIAECPLTSAAFGGRDQTRRCSRR